jgi:hypothetical protein
VPDLSRRQVVYGAAAVGLAGVAWRQDAALAADPAPSRRMSFVDRGPVLLHGNGPAGCDLSGAREAIVFTDPSRPGSLLMHYDGAGPTGWLACRAESRDGGATWAKAGPVLRLNSNSLYDKASASSPWVKRASDGTWHMYYLGAKYASSSPRYIPIAPYTTMHATSASALGPWKQTGQVAVARKSGTWYGLSASPGPVLRLGKQWVIYFSGACSSGMSIGTARSSSPAGPWTVDPEPLVPITQRLENAALHYDRDTRLWWMLANHIGTAKGSDGLAYTDGIWAYWSRRPTDFSPSRSAVVLDGSSTSWTKVIGMPSILRQGHSLQLYYDGIKGRARTDHMSRDIGLATLRLPLAVPR